MFSQWWAEKTYSEAFKINKHRIDEFVADNAKGVENQKNKLKLKCSNEKVRCLRLFMLITIVLSCSALNILIYCYRKICCTMLNRVILLTFTISYFPFMLQSWKLVHSKFVQLQETRGSVLLIILASSNVTDSEGLHDQCVQCNRKL